MARDVIFSKEFRESLLKIYQPTRPSMFVDLGKGDYVTEVFINGRVGLPSKGEGKMLFQVAIVKKPTPKGIEEGQEDELVLEPTSVLASSKEAAIVAAMQKAGKAVVGVGSQRLEVLVRPFA